MSMTDPLADMLTRIRNAGVARLDKVEVPGSNLKRKIAEIMKQEGYIQDLRFIADNKQGVLELELRYDENRNLVINEMQRVSRPGRRVYAKASEIPKVRNGLGVMIVSTSQGVMTDKEARRRGVGGELVCQIW